MRPLKILLLAASYWEESRSHDNEEGGPTRQLAEAVAALGHEVVVLSQSPEVKKLKRIPLGALETWVSPRGRRRGLFTALRDRWVRKAYSHPNVYSDARTLRDFLTQRGPFDVVWAHAETPDGLVTAIAEQRRVKLPPVLLQIQGLPCRFEKDAPVFTGKPPLSLAFRQAKRILANSEMVANMLPTYAGLGLTAADLQAKVHVVYPNLQRAFFRAAQENQSARAPMKDRVLFLGELNQRKGAPVFLKALPKVKTSKKTSVFAIIGDFTDNNKAFIKHWEETKADIRFQLGARVEHLGRADTNEVIRQIKLASVVVVPSLFDAFARVVVEALILGRPVVTTDKVGASPLVRAHQCGVIIAPNDPDTLARAIDVVLSPIVPFAATARLLGLRQFQEFSPEAVALQIVQHLGEITAPEK